MKCREDMVKRAVKNVQVMAPNPSRHTLKMGDIYEGIDETGVDRVVLDVPEPWRAVSSAGSALSGGGHPAVFPAHHSSRCTTFVKSLPRMQGSRWWKP